MDKSYLSGKSHSSFSHPPNSSKNDESNSFSVDDSDLFIDDFDFNSFSDFEYEAADPDKVDAFPDMEVFDELENESNFEDAFNDSLDINDIPDTNSDEVQNSSDKYQLRHGKKLTSNSNTDVSSSTSQTVNASSTSVRPSTSSFSQQQQQRALFTQKPLRNQSICSKKTHKQPYGQTSLDQWLINKQQHYMRPKKTCNADYGQDSRRYPTCSTSHVGSQQQNITPSVTCGNTLRPVLLPENRRRQSMLQHNNHLNPVYSRSSQDCPKTNDAFTYFTCPSSHHDRFQMSTSQQTPRTYPYPMPDLQRFPNIPATMARSQNVTTTESSGFPRSVSFQDCNIQDSSSNTYISLAGVTENIPASTSVNCFKSPYNQFSPEFLHPQYPQLNETYAPSQCLQNWNIQPRENFHLNPGVGLQNSLGSIGMAQNEFEQLLGRDSNDSQGMRVPSGNGIRLPLNTITSWSANTQNPGNYSSLIKSRLSSNLQEQSIQNQPSLIKNSSQNSSQAYIKPISSVKPITLRSTQSATSSDTINDMMSKLTQEFKNTQRERTQKLSKATLKFPAVGLSIGQPRLSSENVNSAGDWQDLEFFQQFRQQEKNSLGSLYSDSSGGTVQHKQDLIPNQNARLDEARFTQPGPPSQLSGLAPTMEQLNLPGVGGMSVSPPHLQISLNDGQRGIDANSYGGLQQNININLSNILPSDANVQPQKTLAKDMLQTPCSLQYDTVKNNSCLFTAFRTATNERDIEAVFPKVGACL
ncbi:hypothetical protein SK128_011899 [Halocaridina rubra]|uniref:Uncharacterized protein n=1 Tax=Halocaridina rubra TaxID=373956 RepID=A0AAN8WUJ9_HALRR